MEQVSLLEIAWISRVQVTPSAAVTVVEFRVCAIVLPDAVASGR